MQALLRLPSRHPRVNGDPVLLATCHPLDSRLRGSDKYSGEPIAVRGELVEPETD